MKTVAICGSTCVGKTTLIRTLETRLTNFYTINENAEKNPFFKTCFNNSSGESFKSQLMFYIEYLRNMSQILQNDYDLVLFDRYIEEHLLISRFRRYIGELTESEMYICENLANSIKLISPKIDKLIYLNCSLETAINRKISRNKNWDKDINHDYLNALRNMYDDWFFDISKTFDQNNILRLDTDAPINIDKIFEFINK